MNSAPNKGLNSEASEKRQSDGDPSPPQGPVPTSPHTGALIREDILSCPQGPQYSNSFSEPFLWHVP